MNPLNKILLGIGAGLVLIFVIALAVLCLINAHLRVELAEAQANDTACQITNDAFRAKAEQQDRAITALQAASTERAQKAEQAVKAAETQAAVFQAEATRIARQKSSGDDCKAAADLIERYRAGVR